MKHINLDDQNDLVKQFVLTLTADAGGSVLELNGQAVACVMPPPSHLLNDNGTHEWNEAKNHRRCELIDRKYTTSLTPDETIELAALQKEMLRYRQQVAPLPLADARRLHQELLMRAKVQPANP